MNCFSQISSSPGRRSGHQKTLLGLLTCAGLLCALCLEGCSRKKDGLAFQNVYEQLDVNSGKNTSLNVDTSWQQFKGRQIQWQAKIVDVRSSRGRAEIFLAHEDAPLYRGYNIVAYSYDIASAGKLRKGDVITFRGNLSNYRQRRGSPLVIFVDNLQLQQ
ncbi:MAG: hypothetical protein D6820_13130 [Lentisphaerae bacterium]|nr:MAG: hypothetical protein D6820_13130 [Lentisphaerota bacterium]